MTKTSYKLDNLGCGACADKMTRAIGKIEGVQEAKVNFLTSKLRIRAQEEDLDRILEEAQREISKIERDCKIVL
ncbi:MAG: heavy-metal-associated domain-containing protein [Tissierellia bacterium]|nr:heavy-metal-associated domain-containing protein [Tissierellia bacterium]